MLQGAAYLFYGRNFNDLGHFIFFDYIIFLWINLGIRFNPRY